MSGGTNYGSCCYAECTNSYSTNSNAIFFKFPNDDLRRKKWIANCGNPEVAQLSDRHLRGKRICALHFPDNSFTDPAKRETLNDKAVPNKYMKQVKTEPEVEEAAPAPAAETPATRRGGRQPAKPAASPTREPAASVKTRRGSETPKVQAPAEDTKKRTVTHGNCSYAECTNSSTNSEVILFTFPTEETRRKKWVVNSGNPDLAHITNFRAKRICAEHFPDSAFTDAAKKDTLTDKAVPVKYTAPRQKAAEAASSEESEPEETEPEKKKAESPNRTQSPTRAESPKRALRGGRQPPKEMPKLVAEGKTKADKEKDKEPASAPASVPAKRPNVAKVQSAFGKSLYTLLNGFLYDDEPSAKKEKRSYSKATESVSSAAVENRTPIRLPNGRTIKAEPMEPKYEKVSRMQNIHKLPPIRPVGQRKSQASNQNQMIQQFMNIENSGDQGQHHGGLQIIQNGGEFTLAEGQEYEVIGEADANDQIQMVEGDNNEIEIIEVDDQTMAQLTAQNVFFNNSGNIQVTELDPNNMGQIRIINPQDAYFHQYQ